MQKGGDADVENDSDSSNSGIYEAVGASRHHSVKEDNSSKAETPPELPPDRKKNKKKGRGGKTFGKLKKLVKKNTENKNENALHKVVSAPALLAAGLEAGGSTAGGSTGVFNKIGDKLKQMKRSKFSDTKLIDAEVVISSSEYDANDVDEEPLTMNLPLQEIEYIDSSSSAEGQTNSVLKMDPPPLPKDPDTPLEAPPLPPRTDDGPPNTLAPPPPPPKKRNSFRQTSDEELGIAPPRPVR